jgi:hypothetical protein
MAKKVLQQFLFFLYLVHGMMSTFYLKKRIVYQNIYNTAQKSQMKRKAFFGNAVFILHKKS